MKRQAKDFPECPVATTVQLVGSKWKLLIIRNLMAYPEIPPKVEYSMTKLGKSLWPTIEAMQKFGEYYKEQL